VKQKAGSGQKIMLFFDAVLILGGARRENPKIGNSYKRAIHKDLQRKGRETQVGLEMY
jgi:hypothetical protein